MGLKELYEASQLCLEEDILDDAAIFSGRLLRESMADMDENLSKIVSHTLRHPYHRSMAGLASNNVVCDLIKEKWMGKSVERTGGNGFLFAQFNAQTGIASNCQG